MGSFIVPCRQWPLLELAMGYITLLPCHWDSLASHTTKLWLQIQRTPLKRAGNPCVKETVAVCYEIWVADQ